MKNKTSRKTFQARLDAMVDRLRRDIAEGTYAPGTFLPAESALAKRFGLSNKSVRKGLQLLVDEGLIVKINRVGNRVTGIPSQAEVSLTLGCSMSIERDFELRQLLADFHKQYPWIRVRTVSLIPSHPMTPSHYLRTVKDYLENGLVDVITMNHPNFQEFVDNGCLHLLEAFPVNREIYPFLTKAFTHEGVLYVCPLAFSPIVLCYNREHFRKARLLEPDSSWTWDDLVRTAEILGRPDGRLGFYFYLLSENRWPAFLLQSGEKFEWDESGVCDIRGTKLLECARRVKDLIHNRNIFPDYLIESSDDVNQLFLQGKVSMILSSYFTMNEFKHTNVPYDIAPLPQSDLPSTLTIVIGMAVNSRSREMKAAKLLVDYFASHRTQQLIKDLTLSIPAVKPVAEQVGGEKIKLNRPPHYAMFREHIPAFRLHSDLNLSDAEFHTVRNLLKKYWSKMIDEETLCEEIRRHLRRPT